MRYLLLTFLLITASCAPGTAERNNTAIELQQRGEVDAAITAFQQAIVSDPDNPQIYFNAAPAYFAKGDIQTAVEAFNQAMQRGDEDMIESARYNLANLYLQAEQYESAIKQYQLVLLGNPQHDDARFNLEIALSMREQPTPTAIEIQTEPDQQQVNPSVTPSPNPGGFAEPSPTPTPPPNVPPGPDGAPQLPETPGGEQADSPFVMPTLQGEMTVEEAQRILDIVEQQQEGLGGIPTFAPVELTPGSVKDW